MSHHDKHVVVGIDGSDTSIALLDWAATYAAMVGADVKVVGASRRHELSDDRFGKAEDDLPEALEDRLQHFVRQTCTGVPHHVLVAKTDPVAPLLRESEGADLIVIGASSDDRGKRLGPATLAVLRQATCPVVVVPTVHRESTSTRRKEAS